VEPSRDPGQPPRIPPRTTARRPPSRQAADPRQTEALRKIAKSFRRLNVPRQRGGPQFLFVLLVLLGIALVLFKVFQLRREGEERTRGIESAPVAAAEIAGPLDPENYREPIESFETVLLGDSADVDLGATLEAIGGRGEELAQRLENGPDKAGPAAATALRGVLAPLEEAVASGLAAPTVLDQVTETRLGWVRLRARVFDPASFFRQPSLNASLDRLALAAWRSAVQDLQSLIASAADRADLLRDEIRTNPEAGSRANAREELQEMLATLRSDLAALEDGAPARPTGADIPPALMLTVQSYEQARAIARGLAASEINLSQEDPRFQEFQARIEAAASSLDDLGA
jgi:hypothetical protein